VSYSFNLIERAKQTGSLADSESLWARETLQSTDKS